MQRGVTARREPEALAPRQARSIGFGPIALAMLGAWACAGGPLWAADIAEPVTPGRFREESVAAMPRYFPRAEGEDSAAARFGPMRRQTLRCRTRRVPVPTDAPDDPSYVGSAYGLGKPSYYGFTPPLGVDDPYGRPLLPYCP